MSADVTAIGSKPGRDKPKCLMEADIAALTAWNRTHKRGLEPVATPVPERLTVALVALADRWPERFRAKVEISDGCWEWQAGKADGYGRYATGKNRESGSSIVITAHRAGWVMLYGEESVEGLVLDHRCRNRGCVRPDHLEPISYAENVRRGMQSNTGSGLCRAGLHPWIEGNILVEASGTRRCKPCCQAKERVRAQRRSGSRREGSK